MSKAQIITSSPEDLIKQCFSDLHANDHAFGDIRHYKSPIAGFPSWYGQEEHRLPTLRVLTPIALIGYRNFLQQTQSQVTNTVNGHVSTLRVWCFCLSDFCTSTRKAGMP